MSTDKENKNNSGGRGIVYDACPHCGRVLSPWEKVLLNVDRMLVCKGCWYRIILDVYFFAYFVHDVGKKDPLAGGQKFDL